MATRGKPFWLLIFNRSMWNKIVMKTQIKVYHEIFVERIYLKKSRIIWEDNIKMDFVKVYSGNMSCIKLPN
jgi:hypothetical protein